MILPQKLYIEAIEDILSKHKKINADIVMDGYADFFYQKTVTGVDEKLMKLTFDSQLNQTMLDAFLENWDIECAGSEKALLLAYVMKEHPELTFNEYTSPRLKGLLNFFRFKNLKLIAYYTKIGSELNRAGIVPMILKGGAMKYLRPDLPRVMGDIDILVRTEEEYQKAKEIAKQMGYNLEDNIHSVDLHLPNSEEGILDIHQYIEMGSSDESNILEDLFKRATKKKVFGVETYIPCPEDMIFISLVNMVKNLREKTSLNGILYNMFDLKYFKTNNIDWNIIRANIVKTKTSPQVCIAYKFINKICPDFIPELLVQDKKIQKEITSYCNRDVFYYLYVYPVKYVCKELHLKNEIKSWSRFKYYLKVKGQHFFTKRIIKSQVLVDLFLKIAH